MKCRIVATDDFGLLLLWVSCTGDDRIAWCSRVLTMCPKALKEYSPSSHGWHNCLAFQISCKGGCLQSPQHCRLLGECTISDATARSIDRRVCKDIKSGHLEAADDVDLLFYLTQLIGEYGEGVDS